MSSVTTTHAPKGLEGVVATNSRICYIDGERGVLAYRGIDIHELADHSNFEETCYLLWFGKLPSRRELANFVTAWPRSASSMPPSSICCAMRPDTPFPWTCSARQFRRCRFTIQKKEATTAKPMWTRQFA